MAIYSQEIYKLVTAGLKELEESQLSGKIQKNPVSETHFLSAWVTKAIKQQVFDRCVIKTLMSWQQQARSMGKNAQLKQNFEHIAEAYAGIRGDDGKAMIITRDQVQSLYQVLEQKGWLVTTEFEVNRKVTHHTEGQASLVVCVKQFRDVFSIQDESTEQVELAKPLSFYVRGSAQELIDTAFSLGLLLFKVTDYKSKVKYHGEYVLYPHNNGAHLPELPTREM
ncbi:DUF2913 family protein [Photobacterium lipolyticum]|uniref:DUF2913 domain-containing protein n=1 Tax=Photobacterium lipolyticum TaxID=266810 RepID=A0A2T3MUZ0_9GAMM|nr:DUF2913 family protein [Photobacterium lipolyticum]PSW03774.1 hypothetical protein C9I89_16730 [Photobacterium lipolyticum]